MGAAVGATRGRRGGGIVGINVTPMVDVVLVLLVIMMVSATYIVSQALKVELPKTASTDETVSTVVQVTVTIGCTMFRTGDTAALVLDRLKNSVGAAAKAGGHRVILA